MTIFDSIILGIVEGLTEFLPVSSTGHLTITEKLLGLELNDPAVTAYTAVIQMGAIAAVLVYFARDIRDIAWAWLRGIGSREARSTADYRLGWYVIVGSLPIGLVGFAGKDVISGPLRSLWWVAGALIAWSAVMVIAERRGTQSRAERDMTVRDAVMIGLFQVVALIPGVSRSGATISAGLLAGLDRVTATRMSFFMSIPALLAAGLLEAPHAFGGSISTTAVIVATVVSFIVAYAAVAWLLRFVAHHPITWFVPYRLALGAVLIVLLATGTMSAT